MANTRIFLLDYVENHPLGIILDWILTSNPSSTILIVHISEIPYCKSGIFRIRKNSRFIRTLKLFRFQLALTLLRLKGFTVIKFADKFSLQPQPYAFPSLISEISTDFVCYRDLQASFLESRVSQVSSFVSDSFNTLRLAYISFLELHLSSVLRDEIDVFIFNGRALRQKAFQQSFLDFNANIFLIERNMWNPSRTIMSRDRIQSFNYLQEDKCNDYGKSEFDVSYQHLFDNIMLKQYSQDHSDTFDSSQLTHYSKTITYFTGSSDEYAAFTSEVYLDDCKTQFELIRYLVKYCADNQVGFILRIHPNSKHKSFVDKILWDDMCAFVRSQGFVAYKYDSCVDSYALATYSDAVITNGSTISIESCLLGKSVFLCGFNGLRNYDASIIPNSLNDLSNQLDSVLFQDKNVSSEQAKLGAGRYLDDELASGRRLMYYSFNRPHSIWLKFFS